MIECPSCGKKHRPGTLFCTECGAYLPAGGTLRTNPLPTHELPRYSPPSGEEGAPAEEGEVSGQGLYLEIVDSQRQVDLPLNAETLLGREDAAHGIFPDLDLSMDGGLEKGVSRRHAKIVYQGGEFYIEDVGSANGTFLNDRRLTPYLPYPLKAGDTIQLGELRLVVKRRAQAE